MDRERDGEASRRLARVLGIGAKTLGNWVEKWERIAICADVGRPGQETGEARRGSPMPGSVR
jgi:hypothetical protein